MEKSVEEAKDKFVFDTSAFLSLESVDLLDILLKENLLFTTNSVIGELEDFAQYDDELGKVAKKILTKKNKISTRDVKIKEVLEYVSNTDKEVFNLALKEKVTLITDDVKFSRHADLKTVTEFSTFFLTSLVNSQGLTKQQALEKLEKMRSLRGWQNNIIYIMARDKLNDMDN
jgi:rRNA-processing protein FCF1